MLMSQRASNGISLEIVRIQRAVDGAQTSSAAYVYT